MIKVLFILLLITMSGALFAIPYAVLGNINIPDAYILPNKMMEFSLTNYFILAGTSFKEAQEGVVGGADGYNLSFSASVGLFDRFELGFVATNYKLYFGNFKVKLFTETEKVPSIALGLENLFSKVQNSEEATINIYDFTDPEDYIKNSFYVVLSKSVLLLSEVPVFEHLETTFHLGVGNRRFKGHRSIVKDLNGLFGGIDLKPSQYVSFNGEIDGHNLNLGINAYYKNFTVRTCVYRLEDMFKNKDNAYYGQKFALGIKYTLDKFSEVKASDKERPGYQPASPRVKQRTIAGSLADTEAVESSGEVNPLLEELRLIRERRKQAEKELEEIRKLLKE
jgi:hypothetical protein